MENICYCLGVRFKCDLCDFTALDKTVITKHVKVEHEGFRYNCDECEFSCKNQNSLSGHQQTQHSGTVVYRGAAFLGGVIQYKYGIFIICLIQFCELVLSRKK